MVVMQAGKLVAAFAREAMFTGQRHACTRKLVRLFDVEGKGRILKRIRPQRSWWR